MTLPSDLIAFPPVQASKPIGHTKIGPGGTAAIGSLHADFLLA
jgi:hypothetical protein